MTEPTTAEIRELANRVIKNGQAEYGNPNWLKPADFIDGADDADAAYIAAVSPECIIGVLNRLAAAEKKIADIKAELEHVQFV